MNPFVAIVATTEKSPMLLRTKQCAFHFFGIGIATIGVLHIFVTNPFLPFVSLQVSPIKKQRRHASTKFRLPVATVATSMVSSPPVLNK